MLIDTPTKGEHNVDLKEYYNLRPGDVIQNLGSGSVYIVLEIHKPGITTTTVAVRTVIVDNPDEWKIVRKSAAIEE